MSWAGEKVGAFINLVRFTARSVASLSREPWNTGCPGSLACIYVKHAKRLPMMYGYVMFIDNLTS